MILSSNNSTLSKVQRCNQGPSQTFRMEHLPTIQGDMQKSMSNFEHKSSNIYKYNTLVSSKCNFDNYPFFSLLTFLGEIIELYLRYGNYLENVMPTLHKETKNKASMLKINGSCYFHFSPSGVFRTLLSI